MTSAKRIFQRKGAACPRAVSAETNGDSNYPQWGMSESYDRYGNRLSQSVTAGSAPSSNLSFTANNQPVGYTFDPSGNMTMEPLIPQQNYMTYDGENRMTAVSGNTAASYGYDGNGMRVIKSIEGGTTTVSIYSAQPEVCFTRVCLLRSCDPSWRDPWAGSGAAVR